MREKTTGQKLLSKMVVFGKYARYDHQQHRRETVEEIFNRYEKMMIKKFPRLEADIKQQMIPVYDGRAVPSMRALQFAGLPIEINNNRMYNCGYMPIDDPYAFKELMYLLLCGAGIGYSVKQRDISKLPPVLIQPDHKLLVQHAIEDSIEGWADAVLLLIRAWTDPTAPFYIFDFDNIRPEGAEIHTAGGFAPGPEPLRETLKQVGFILARAQGRQLMSVEVFDICCWIALAVYSGGIRRAATICLFDRDDRKMLYSKTGAWYAQEKQRAMANISVVLPRSEVRSPEFNKLFDIMHASNAGEPGFFWTNDEEMGCNPCQPGWATVLTPEGIRTFDDIDVGSTIWSKDGWVKVVKKVGSGNKHVYKYRTSAGEFIGTPNHRIVSDGVKVPVGEAESIDVLGGPVKKGHLRPEDIMAGLLLGDGGVHKASNNLPILFIGDNDQDYFKSEVKDMILEKRRGLNPKAYTVVVPEPVISQLEKRTYDRVIPDYYRFGDSATVVGFLRGLFTANGSVVRTRVTLKGSSRKVITTAQEMLSSVGIRSYITTNKPSTVRFSNGTYTCRESYDLNISTDRFRFLALVGFIQDYKNDKVKGKTCKEGVKTLPITERTYCGVHAVYDITVNGPSHTYWSGGHDVSNCGEISLRPNTFCNLTEVNVGACETEEEYMSALSSASFFGTLQASFTDFKELRSIWKTNTEEDRLIGVSLTGICTYENFPFSLKRGAQWVNEVNEETAKRIGIPPAKRTTTIKPSGTASLYFGTSSGIHPYYAPFYIRRVRLKKNEVLSSVFRVLNPSLVEDDLFTEENYVVSIPVKSPPGCITREESSLDMLRRIRYFYNEWIKPGFSEGVNQNNISATVSVRQGEWDEVKKWLWENRDAYQGLTILPYDGSCYKQTPFEEIPEEVYEQMHSDLTDIDFHQINELVDHTNPSGEIACGGGACEVSYI